MAGSKTARRSTVTTGKVTDEMRVKEASRAPSARIVPLAGGRLCYFRQPLTDRLLKVNPNSEAFVEAIRPGCALGMAERIHEELTALAATYPESQWGDVLARVTESGVLGDGS